MPFFSFLLVGLSILGVSHAQVKGMQCASHPLYTNGMKHEIIRSWSYAPDNTNRMVFEKSFYQPRYDKHAYAPLQNLNSTTYAGLDLFVSNFGPMKANKKIRHNLLPTPCEALSHGSRLRKGVSCRHPARVEA